MDQPALGVYPGLLETDILRLDVSALPPVERRLVVRSPGAEPKVKTPEWMWVIPSTEDLPFLPCSGADVMIRQEYHDLLSAILWSLYRQSQVAQLPRDFPLALSPSQ
jgi:hypothetical protein